VPRWYLLTEKNSPDVKSLGEYVVVKPDCGGRGAEVRIKRAARVRWKAPTNARAVSMNQLDLIAQRFIYTGPWPVSYRVTTLFGKTLFAWQARADSKRQALLGPDRFENGGLSICSMGQGCKFELCNDREIIDLGERVHQAFPRNPLLGIDIVREQPTGKLYVIEVNSCGQVWHFSSPMGCGIQRESKIDFESQFNGIRKAADILIEQTRFLAR
jgi:glutathione synthase/RimK-type ligase-like ATP-grasp enzyme